MTTIINRCPWATHSPLEQHYHDTHWGKPCHDEQTLFKFLILEGQQAGLSWSTILKKMPTLCAAYDDFNPEQLRQYDDVKIAELLNNPGIIRNRLKVNAAITNAQAYETLCAQHRSLDNFLWSYVNHTPIINHWETASQVPAHTELSDTISKDLKKLGFKFVGSTIIYAYLQAIGIINDHLVSCDCHPDKDN